MSSVQTNAVTARSPGFAVAAVISAQLAGNGCVMTSTWLGADGIARYNLAAVVFSASVVVLAGLAVTVTPDAELPSEPSVGWRSLVPTRPAYVALGAAVALLLPLVWGTPGGTTLMYALPWGAGLAAAGWLRDRAALAVGVTVVASAVVCALFAVSSHVPVYYATVPSGD
jgi:hypothetical protein